MAARWALQRVDWLVVLMAVKKVYLMVEKTVEMLVEMMERTLAVE